VSYALTIEIEGNGTVNEEIVQAKSTTDYDSGTTVKLTAIPDDGWIFVGWSGDHNGTENPIQLTMDQAMSITAKFEKTLSIPINIWVFGNGSVEKEWIGDPAAGNSMVRLTAKANEGSYFVHIWGIPDKNNFGDFLTTENPVEFDLNEALMIIDSDQLFLIAFFKEGVAAKTPIPDDHFEQALIDLGYDDQLDGFASTQVISRIEELDISNRNIQDLSGLEDFISLQMFNCSQNNIKSLKLPRIPEYKLNLQDNELTDLDLSEIGEILSLDIRNNLLTCVQVNENQLEQVANPGLAIWYRDEGVVFSLDCGN
jgi:uncharacterized repeat protein (TIGR02543 family)